MPNSNKNAVSSIDDWNEYKRLVLAELERLNDCVEKLRDKCGHIDEEVSEKVFTISNKVNEKVKEIDENIKISIKKDISVLEDKITKLELYAEKNSIKEHKSTSLTFWTTLLTVACALITSIVSLFVSIWYG